MKNGSDRRYFKYVQNQFSWRWIWRSLILRKRQSFMVLILTAIVYVSSIVFPISMQKSIDILMYGDINGNIILLWFLAIIFISIEGAASYFRTGIIIKLATFLDRRISRIIFVHLMRAKNDSLNVNSGDVLNHYAQANKIREFILYQVPNLILDIGGAVVALILITYYDIFVGFILIFITPMLILTARKRFSAARSIGVDIYTTNGTRNNSLTETVTGLTTIKAHALEGIRYRNFWQLTNRLLHQISTLSEISRDYSLRAQLASRVVTLMVVSVGCWRLYNGHLTIGQLLAIQIITWRFTSPILASGDLYRLWQEVHAAVRHITTFLETPREKPNVWPPMKNFIDEGLTVKDLSFTYPGSNKAALFSLNFQMPHKGVVAIVGRNGSGKTTLVRLIQGFLSNYSGTIYLFGSNVLDYDQRWLRKQIASVEQDAMFFSGTIRENLVGNEDIDKSTIEFALDFAGAADFVNSLPEGLDSKIDINARSLSGGQRQRLAIARAVVKQAKFVILDEPSSFLDAEAARKLDHKITLWGKDRLLIIVTHHLAAIRDADQIFVLDDGHLVGNDTHEILIRKVPKYKSLWDDYTRSISDSIVS